MGRVFANSPGDLGSISGHVIPKTLKMVLHASLFNTQKYKVRIKGKVEQSRERSSTLHYTTVTNFTLYICVCEVDGDEAVNCNLIITNTYGHK